MTDAERAVLREETRLLGREVAALDADQQLFVLLVLAGSVPDAVRHALDTERATRPAEADDSWKNRQLAQDDEDDADRDEMLKRRDEAAEQAEAGR